jgi:hypothetical protein
MGLLLLLPLGEVKANASSLATAAAGHTLGRSIPMASTLLSAPTATILAFAITRSETSIA